MVSGQYAGNSAAMAAVMLAAHAVAALVPFVVVSRCWVGSPCVVSTCNDGGVSKSVCAGDIARLPPSRTISGLIGHWRANSRDVRLKGESSPAEATTDQPW